MGNEKQASVIAPKPVIAPLSYAAHTGTLDLKESIEMLHGLKFILESIKEVLADGKIDWKDSMVAFKIMKKFEIFSAAAKDFKIIPDELKDLSEEECCLLGKEIHPLLQELKEIVRLSKAL